MFSGSSLHLPLPEASTGLPGSDKVSSSSSISHLCQISPPSHRQMVLVLSVDTNTQEARKRRLDVICRDTLTAVFLHIDPEHVIYLLQHSKSPWVHKQGLVLDSRCRPLLVSDVGRHREHSVMLTKWFVKWSWCCQLTQTLWSIRRRLHT